MQRQKPLVNKDYLLQKFQGKSAWTYAAIPEIAQDRHSRFGLLKVSGSIDNYELKNVKLMPLGNGNLFLPVKAAIRKAIKKEEGDKVRIILYADVPEAVVPEEILTCLQDEPLAFEAWKMLPKPEQQERIARIMETKRDETKVERIVQMIDELCRSNPLPKKVHKV